MHETAWNALQFVIKHAVAAALVVGGIVVLAAATYLALLIGAALSNGHMGSPATGPLMVLMALVGGVASVLLVLLPTTAATEWVCHKWRWHLALQIPIATVLLLAYVLAAAMAIAVFRGNSLAAATRVALGISAVLLVPLVAYWLALQSTDWLIRVGTRRWNEFKRSRSIDRDRR